MSSIDDVSPFALSELEVDVLSSTKTPDEMSMSAFFKSDLKSYEDSLKELEKRIEKSSFGKSTKKDTEASIKKLEKHIVDALSLTLDQRTEIFQQARKDYDTQLKLTRKDLEKALKKRIKLEEELEEWKIKCMEIKDQMARDKEKTKHESKNDDIFSGVRKRNGFDRLKNDVDQGKPVQNKRNTKKLHVDNNNKIWKGHYVVVLLLSIMLILNIAFLLNYYK
jgi:hypothetical protein